MKYVMPALLLALGGGFALARWLPPGEPAASADAGAAPGPGFDASMPVTARLAELERAVAAERDARQLLEEELLYLMHELDRLDARMPGEAGGAESPDAGEAAAATVAEGPARRVSRGGREGGRAERLVAAGFSPERADWIVQRESRYRMAMLEARHEAQRTGNYEDYNEIRAAEQQAFRDELGQAEYERYLEGTGRPTSVVVTGVMDTSPAQRAGLQPGDRIVSYGGLRIYSMSELNRATLAGSPGETVYLQIEREGMPMQVAIPRGPVGITGSGRR